MASNLKGSSTYKQKFNVSNEIEDENSSDSINNEIERTSNFQSKMIATWTYEDIEGWLLTLDSSTQQAIHEIGEQLAMQSTELTGQLLNDFTENILSEDYGLGKILSRNIMKSLDKYRRDKTSAFQETNQSQNIDTSFSDPYTTKSKQKSTQLHPKHLQTQLNNSATYITDSNDSDVKTQERRLLVNKNQKVKKSSFVQEVNIIVLGETGSGKSTFINTLTNFYRDGSLKSLLVSIPTKYLKATEEFTSNELNIKTTTSSKTDGCNIYSFNCQGRILNFIDTPGLSDTRGTAQDDKNLDKIMEAAANAQNLTAIILVINGTSSRLTLNLTNVLVRLRGSLPDILFQNILAVLTNCLEHTCNFDLNCLKLKPKKVFHMNNSAFSTDPTRWNKNASRMLQLEWELSMQTMAELSETILSMNSQATSAFKDMKAYRFQIKQTLHDARLRISHLQELQDELAIAETQFKKYGQDAQQFQNYTRKKQIEKKELVDAPYHSTICSRCNSVCHDRCGLEEIASRGSNAFKNCACMSGDNCHVCEGRCSYTTHYHAKKTMKITSQTLEEVLDDIKAKFDAAQNGKNVQTQKINSVKDAQKAVENAIDTLNKEVANSCKKLKKICSGFNLVDELNELINQLQMDARQLNSTHARKTADQFIRSIQTICDGLSQ